MAIPTKSNKTGFLAFFLRKKITHISLTVVPRDLSKTSNYDCQTAKKCVIPESKRTGIEKQNRGEFFFFRKLQTTGNTMKDDKLISYTRKCTFYALQYASHVITSNCLCSGDRHNTVPYE